MAYRTRNQDPLLRMSLLLLQKHLKLGFLRRSLKLGASLVGFRTMECLAK